MNQALNPSPLAILNPEHIYALLIQEGQKQAKEARKAEIKALGEPEGAGHGRIKIVRTCGDVQTVRELCSNPLCASCEKIKADKRRMAWYPVLKAMKNPRMLTFTIRDGPDLRERMNFLQESFRRFMSLRLGPRNLDKLISEALGFVSAQTAVQVAKGTKIEAQRQSDLTRWEKSLQAFKLAVIRRHDKKGKWPELRHMIGKGFAAIETTFGSATVDGEKVQDLFWHLHRHLCVDGHFIPWPFLCAAWLRATKGEAFVTHIEQVDKTPEGIKEVAKYLSKTWEIPEGKQAEFIEAVKGIKRIWPLGGAKPAKVKEPCAACGDPQCKGHIAGGVNLLEVGNLYGIPYQIFENDALFDPKRKRFIMVKIGDRWQEAKESEAATAPLVHTLSVCVAVGDRAGPGNELLQ